MRDKAVFAALASCWALGLLLCAWFLVRPVDPALLTRFATALIAAAVMLSARGVAWGRRVGYSLATNTNRSLKKTRSATNANTLRRRFG